MLFKPYFLIPFVYSSKLIRKRATCRIAKGNEAFAIMDGEVHTCHGDSSRIKWKVGRHYAFQTRRGSPTVLIHQEPCCGSVTLFDPRLLDTNDYPEYHKLLSAGWTQLRVMVTGIRNVYLQDLSDDDIFDEGIYGVTGRYHIPCSIDDPVLDAFALPSEAFRCLWNSINKRRGQRWEDNPPVWQLRIEPWWEGIMLDKSDFDADEVKFTVLTRIEQLMHHGDELDPDAIRYTTQNPMAWN